MDETPGLPPTPESELFRAKAARDLSVPAILMMVMGGIWVLYSLFGMLAQADTASQMAALDKVLSQYPPDLQEKLRGFVAYSSAPGFRVLTQVPILVLNGLVVFGAWKMKNLQSYGLAMTAAILCCIPCCGPCCCLGLIPGIWSLILLNRPDVKAAFT
ncbi:hypothetical protein [Corallococcus silvisoli]|uniref:hypothetical protein n=1 Tax=Corallococcus silvisoli TaxID=2697031 RepID=UPI00191C3303|nr:hypothetical protein [Corallococcus silvisoli]